MSWQNSAHTLRTCTCTCASIEVYMYHTTISPALPLPCLSLSQACCQQELLATCLWRMPQLWTLGVSWRGGRVEVGRDSVAQCIVLSLHVYLLHEGECTCTVPTVLQPPTQVWVRMEPAVTTRLEVYHHPFPLLLLLQTP